MSAKGEDTRRDIVNAALALASVRGLEGLSIRSVAEQLQMSKSGMFAHFGSKEHLQVAVIDRAVECLVAVVITPAAREPRGVPRLKALLKNWIQWDGQPFLPGGCLFMAAGPEQDDLEGMARERLVEVQRDWVDTLAHHVRVAKSEGHLRADVDPEQVAFELQGIIASFHRYRRLMRDPDAAGRAERAFDRLIDSGKVAKRAGGATAGRGSVSRVGLSRRRRAAHGDDQDAGQRKSNR